MSYTWIQVPSAFVDVAFNNYLISRDRSGLVARVELSTRLPFHAEHIERFCDLLQTIEDAVNQQGVPLLDGRAV